MAISSVTLTRRRSAGSAASRSTRTPPSISATASPPPAERRTAWDAVPRPVTAPTRAAASTSSAGWKSEGRPDMPERPAGSSSGRSAFGTAVAATATRAAYTTATTTQQASANDTTSTAVRRRASAWAAKKSSVARRPGPGATAIGLELHRHRLALGRGLDLEERGRREGGGEQQAREGLAGVVVAHDRVVVGLPGEGDAVLGGGELLLQRQHVGVGLEVRVGLGHRQEAGEHAGEGPLGAGEGRHGGRVAGAGRRRLGRGQGGVAGSHHRLQRLALELHVTLGGLDQVGDEVVAPLQLDVDLAEGVLVAVAAGDEAVVDGDGGDRRQHQKAEQDEHGEHVPSSRGGRRAAGPDEDATARLGRQKGGPAAGAGPAGAGPGPLAAPGAVPGPGAILRPCRATTCAASPTRSSRRSAPSAFSRPSTGTPRSTGSSSARARASCPAPSTRRWASTRRTRSGSSGACGGRCGGATRWRSSCARSATSSCCWCSSSPPGGPGASTSTRAASSATPATASRTRGWTTWPSPGCGPRGRGPATRSRRSRRPRRRGWCTRSATRSWAAR